MSFFNEIMNSVYLYTLLSLSDYSNQQSLDIRDYQGWCLVLICLVTITVNFIKLIFTKGPALIQAIKKVQIKKRVKLAARKYVEEVNQSMTRLDEEDVIHQERTKEEVKNGRGPPVTWKRKY